MPATLSILTNVFTDPRERALAIGIWSGVAGIAVALGPVAGGFLLEHFWWGSVFIVNVPIVIAALVAGHFLVPNSRNPQAAAARPGRRRAVDRRARSRWSAAIIEAPSNGWTDPPIVGRLRGRASLALAAFVWWERRIDAPDARRALLRATPASPPPASTVTLVFFALFGFIFLATQYLQFVLGYSRVRGRRAHAAVRGSR